MKDKIFQLLKQEYKSLGLGDEVLQAHAEMLDKMGLVTDDNIETVVASQKSFLESLQKDNDRRVTDAKKKFEEAQKAKEDAERKAAEEEAKKNAIVATHTVKSGETLSHIALQYYGHATPAYYKLIYEFNKDVIGDNLNIIIPGQELRIPVLPEELK